MYVIDQVTVIGSSIVRDDEKKRTPYNNYDSNVRMYTYQ